MLLCLICPVFQPVSADAGLSSTDFGILDAMSDIYEIQQSSNSNEEAIEQANLKLNQVAVSYTHLTLPTSHWV